MAKSAYYKLDYSESGSHREQFLLLNLKKIAKRVTFVNEETFLKCTNVEEQIQLITAAYTDTNKVPVICLDSNPFENLNQLAETLKNSTSTPFFILGCDSRPGAYQHSNIDLWPFWLIQQQTEKNYQLGIDPIHRISFLSGVPKNHRLKLFDKIRSHITDQDIIVINKLFSNTVTDPTLQSLMETLPWANQPQLLDVDAESKSVNGFSVNSHCAYSACVNITGESVSHFVYTNHNYDKLHFITEKTWKAYRSGRLVINYGIESLPQTLSHYGFRIWTDYDICGSVDQKINKIVELFQRSDIFEMYQTHSTDILFNQQWVNSDQLAKNMSMPSITKLEKIINSVL